MDKAIEKVNELIAIDMGSLVEEKKGDRRERVILWCLLQGPQYSSHVVAEMA